MSKVYCPQCHRTIEGLDSKSCPRCDLPRPELGFPQDRFLGQLVAGEQYRVIRRVGAGGFGVVYEVETMVGGLRRALKVLGRQWSEDHTVRERFVNEALVLEEVSHPNVARCYAAGRLEEGELYLLFELIEGVQLTTLIDDPEPGKTSVDPARAIRIAKQIAAGLKAAHEAEVLHRDLKPDNILIINAGAFDEQVKIVDFGIAKLTEKGSAHTESIVGTPEFMPPEQFMPGTPLDARVDIWQLGAVLYAMLTGAPPYANVRGGVAGIIAKQQAQSGLGPDPGEQVEALAEMPGLCNLVARMLATNPDERPLTAQIVCEELARLEHVQMSDGDEDRSLALLGALTATPSPSGWSALHGYLSTQSASEQVISVADRLLDAWPDELRAAPNALWQHARKEPTPLWSIVRTLDLSARGLGDDEVVALANSPALARISRLDLSHNEIGNRGLEALSKSPHLGALEHLDLSHNMVSSRGVTSLAEASSVGVLRSLRLAGNGVGARGIKALASSRLRLHELELSDNDIGPEGCAAIAESESLAGLLRLGLRSTGIGAEGIAVLSVAHSLVRLQELDISNNALGASGAATLAIARTLRSLQRLSLAQNGLGRQGLELLLAATGLTQLSQLDLSGNGLGASGAMYLASSSLVRQLSHLGIADNEIGDAGVAALLGSAQLAGLRGLDLARNGISPSGAGLLGVAPPQLRHLDLTHNALGDAGAEAVAEAMSRLRVQELAVAGCEFSGESLAKILDAGRVRELDASRNPIGAEGANALGEALPGAFLETLQLSHVGLGPDGLARLLSGEASHLRRLDLSSNGIEDGGINALVAAAPRLPRLEHLSLTDNDLTARSAEALAASTLARHLFELNLAYNDLGDAGAEAISRGAAWHALRTLDLQGNHISLAGAAAVTTSPRMPLLARINISNNALSSVRDVYVTRPVIEILEETFTGIREMGDDFAELFYETLFARYPGVRPLFAKVSMRKQYRHLMQTLALVVDSLRNPEALEQSVLALGTRHHGYSVSPSHYYAVTSTLLDVMAGVFNDAWTEEIAAAWSDALDGISNVMMNSPRPGAPGASATTAVGRRQS